MSGITFKDKKFQLVIDQFDGIDQGDALASGGMGSFGVAAGKFIDIENGLFDQAVGLRKRGNIANAAGAFDIGSAGSSSFAAMAQVSVAVGATAGPYFRFWVSGTGVGSAVQNSAGAAVALDGGIDITMVSRPAMIGNLLVIPTVADTETGLLEPYDMLAASGFSGTYYAGGGTVTMTQGSATVTGVGTNFTSEMIGSVFFPTSMIGGIFESWMAGIVIKVTNTTTLVLDRPWLGVTIAGVGPNAQQKGPLTAYRRALPFESQTGPRAKCVAAYNSRLFIGNTKEAVTHSVAAPSTAPTQVFGNRMRWSGLIGAASDYAGTGSSNTDKYGMEAYSPTGFYDMPAQFGDIVAMCPFPGGLVVFQKTGMVFMRGNPTFSSPGSLNSETQFPNVQLAGGFAYENTEHGLFFVDKKRGPMLFTGVGAPVTIAANNAPAYWLSTITNGANAFVGAYKDWIVFGGSSIESTYAGTGFTFWGYHAPTGRWTRFKTEDSTGRVVSHFCTDANRQLVALMGNRVVNLSPMFDAVPAATTDTLGTGAYGFGFTTGKFGDTIAMLRPHDVWGTYRATGAPNGTIRVYTGLIESVANLTDISDASFTLAVNANFVTRRNAGASININRGPMIEAYLRDSAATNVEVLRVVVRGDAEGEGESP